MKHIGPAIAVGCTLLILLLVGIFSVLPLSSSAAFESPSVQQVANPASLPQSANLETTLNDWEQQIAERDAAYQKQIDQLVQWQQERQVTYQGQITELTNQVVTVQNQLAALEQQETSIEEQILQLQSIRDERQAIYQAQKQEIKTEYLAHLAQLQQRLDEAKTQLEEANRQIGL